jgi:hypothetical protein
MPGQALPKDVTWLGAFVLSPAYLISGCSRPHFSASPISFKSASIWLPPTLWPPQSPPASTSSLRAPPSACLADSISAGTSRCGGSGSKGRTVGNVIISASRMSVAIFVVSCWMVVASGAAPMQGRRI